MNKIILAALMALPLCGLLVSCDEEREVIIIEEELPLKTANLYIVGDATPAGWNIDAPTPLTQSADDPLVWSWTGHLNPGEFKAPLTTGNWGCNYLMPLTDQCPITHSGAAEPKFQVVPGGNPDWKWRVQEGGDYTITFNLRTYAFDVKYNG